MNINDDIPQQDAAGLRRFGLLLAAVFAGLFGLLFPWVFGVAFPLWPWVISGVLAAWALLHPPSLDPVYRGWMRLGLVLGWFSSRIVLGTLFYLVFTPISWVLRLRGVDPLHRKADPQAKSYRRPSRERDINHMEKPF
jgi:hypothetical protein